MGTLADLLDGAILSDIKHIDQERFVGTPATAAGLLTVFSGSHASKAQYTPRRSLAAALSKKDANAAALDALEDAMSHVKFTCREHGGEMVHRLDDVEDFKKTAKSYKSTTRDGLVVFRRTDRWGKSYKLPDIDGAAKQGGVISPVKEYMMEFSSELTVEVVEACQTEEVCWSACTCPALDAGLSVGMLKNLKA